MKEYVFISGKGGTGKTSLTAAFSLLADNPLVCDADVDAADLHLLLQPKVKERHNFMGGNLAAIDTGDCTGCGRCIELCRFGAINDDLVVDSLSCEGCGVCVDLCPEKAIDFPPQQSGEWYISDCRTGPMVHARLGIAQENSGKLVSLVRRQAKELADQHNKESIITDGPPGIGCPVIACLSGADRAVIVVEPTLSGVHDVKRLISLIHHFSIPAMLCVNRYDINSAITEDIEAYARDQRVMVLPRIPFDPKFVNAMVLGQTIVEYAPASATAKQVARIWQTIESHIPAHVSQPHIINI